MRTCRIETLAAAITVALVSASALARPPEVQARYNVGKQHLDSGDYAGATEAFEDCLRLVSDDPSDRVVMLFALGRTWEAAGDSTGALEYYDRAIKTADRAPRDPMTTALAERAHGRARPLERRVMAVMGALDLTSSPSGAFIEIDDRLAGKQGDRLTPARLFLSPGPHRVHLVLGERRAETTVRITAGERDVVSINIPELARPLPVPDPPAVREPAAPSGTGWWILGAGAAVAAAGIPFTLWMLQDFDAVEALDPTLGPTEGNRRYDEIVARYELNVAMQGTLYGLGGAMILTGIILAALSDDGEAPPPIGATPVSGGLLLNLSGSF